MLKPRRANRPAHAREHAGRFSTSTDSVWWAVSLARPSDALLHPRVVVLDPLGVDHVGRREPPAGTIGYTFSSWSTRKSITAGPPQSSAAADRVVDLLLVSHAEAERRRRPRPASRSRAGRASGASREKRSSWNSSCHWRTMPSQPLLMTHVDRADAVHRGRGQLLHRHLEAAVAVDVDRRSRRAGRPWRRSRPGTPKPIVPSPPDVSQCRRPVDLQLLRRPHLVLADAGRPDHLAVGESGRAAARSRTPASAAPRGGSGTGTRAATPRTVSSHSRCLRRAAVLARLRAPRVSLGTTSSQRAHDRDRRPSRFLSISAGSMSMWITFAPGANASSLPVTRSSKRAPHGDQQVGPVHRPVRGLRAVHAGQADAERVRVGERRPWPSASSPPGSAAASASAISSAGRRRR